MKRPRKGALIVIVLLVLLVIVGLVVLFWPGGPKPVLESSSGLPAPCRDVQSQDRHYLACTVDLRQYDVTLYHDDKNGKPYGSVTAFDAAMRKAHTVPVLAMNAGMYRENLSPVGLYVEDGKVLSPLNQDSGQGNFFLKPNGVFMIGKNGDASVMTTEAYAAAHPDPLYATQSGPMLVIDGAVNPAFEQDGSSRYIRNGVGMVDPHTIELVISRTPVSFGAFARLFKDKLHCANVLYLDGEISTLSNGWQPIIGGGYPAGPIIAVRKKK